MGSLHYLSRGFFYCLKFTIKFRFFFGMKTRFTRNLGLLSFYKHLLCSSNGEEECLKKQVVIKSQVMLYIFNESASRFCEAVSPNTKEIATLRHTSFANSSHRLTHHPRKNPGKPFRIRRIILPIIRQQPLIKCLSRRHRLNSQFFLQIFFKCLIALNHLCALTV